MSVASKIQQLETDITNAYDSIETMGGTIPEHKNTNNLATAIESIPSGGDLSEYLNDTLVGGGTVSVGSLIKKIPDNLTISGTSLQNVFKGYQGTYVPILNTSGVIDFSSMFYQAINITTIPQYDTSSGTDLSYMFRDCYKLESIPLLNISHASSVSNMFNGCSQLTTVPILDISNIRYNYQISSMFNYCSSLSAQSLDNILQMCIGATSFTGTKTLSQVGLSSSYYSASTIQALPHYQDFVNAGWTIGWS